MNISRPHRDWGVDAWHHGAQDGNAARVKYNTHRAVLGPLDHINAILYDLNSGDAVEKCRAQAILLCHRSCEQIPTTAPHAPKSTIVFSSLQKLGYDQFVGHSQRIFSTYSLFRNSVRNRGSWQ